MSRGGTLQYGGANTTDVSSHFSSAPKQAYSIETNGAKVTFARALTSGGTITKLGAGTLTLFGSNTSADGTMVR